MNFFPTAHIVCKNFVIIRYKLAASALVTIHHNKSTTSIRTNGRLDEFIFRSTNRCSPTTLDGGQVEQKLCSSTLQGGRTVI